MNLADITPGTITAALAMISAKANEKLLLEIYGDIKKSGVNKVGHALANVLELATGNFDLYTEKKRILRAYHLEQYRKNLEKVADDKIVEVAPEVGVPIIDKLEKTTNEILSEMYINLLTNASIEDYAGNVHPRFTQVIENLTPDEVRIIEPLKQVNHRIPFITIIKKQEYFKKGTVRTPIAEKATEYENNNFLNMPEKSRFYFDNLEALGILTSDMIGENRSAYNNEYDDLMAFYPELYDFNFQLHNEVHIEKGFYQLTHFGLLFKQACQKNPM
ncbi:DUF4393 domain-containing protein [Hymenobacter sp. BT18]|uniref:DUF4393 domain-containing protein n=1 Tax=Hymenobacter sp. BT18 TaxID=2835648 RepID=UPI00143E91BB|nr:DUF4393 domain-containing protein [Hymenobacter sp. BT18]QIX59693.1 DUF4393 domain-containing protein [Hymenobacter sp. BT18]